MSRATRWLGWALTGALLATIGCKTESKDQLYFKDLKPVLGAGKVEVVKDQSLNKDTGGEVTVLAVVEPKVDKDELDRLMKSWMRQVSRRRGFKKGPTPQKVDLRFYTSKAAAEKGGDDWLARAERTSRDDDPLYTNNQKAPLLKWAQKILKPSMAVFTGDLKPQLLADADKMQLEVQWPFVTDDGSGKYVEELSYTKATQNFYATTRELFEKIPTLTKLTFVGKHNDKVMMRIWMTRDQYTSINMTDILEKKLHAYQGQFVQELMAKKMTEKQVMAKTAKRRHEVFKEIFAKLPEQQVELDKSLQ